MFELDDEYAESDIPTTLIRSKADCPNMEVCMLCVCACVCVVCVCACVCVCMCLCVLCVCARVCGCVLGMGN